MKLVNTYKSKVKRYVCDRFIIFLSLLIRKCATKKEFDKHLNKLQDSQIKSKKFEHIDSKKEELYSAISSIENKNKELHETHKVIANSLIDIKLNVINKEENKAIEIIDYILNFYEVNMQIKVK